MRNTPHCQFYKALLNCWEKKITFAESETIIDSLYKIEDKIYGGIYDDSSNFNMGLLEYKNSKYNIPNILDEESTKNKLQTLFKDLINYRGEQGKVVKFKYNYVTDSEEIIETIPLESYDETSSINSVIVKDEKIYVYEGIKKEIAILDLKGKKEKAIELSELIKKLDITFTENDYVWPNFYIYDTNKAPYIVMDIEIYKDDVKDKYINATFDLEGNLISSLVDSDNKIMDYAEFNIENNKAVYKYTSCEEEYKKCSYIVETGEEKKVILTSEENIYGYTTSGFNIVTEYNPETEISSTKRTLLYDHNFNLIKEFENVNVYIMNVIDITYWNSYERIETIQNDMYLLQTSAYDRETYEPIEEYERSYILNIEDSKKVNVTGYLKDKDVNPLKETTVELHSTPRTVVTDENGYFKFENVEEGDHTLTIKDKDGKVLATKEIKVLEGAETKLDEDTLYFNLDDKGMNLNIKIEDDKLTIDSIEKGTKEPIKQNEVPEVPKTFDSLTNSIIMLITLILSTIFVIKKTNKIKYIHN